MKRARLTASASARWFPAVRLVRRRGIILPCGLRNFLIVSVSFWRDLRRFRYVPSCSLWCAGRTGAWAELHRVGVYLGLVVLDPFLFPAAGLNATLDISGAPFFEILRTGLRLPAKHD